MPRRSRLFLFPTLKGSSLIVFKRAFLLYFICSENTRQEIWIIRCKYRVRQVTAVSRKKKAARKWTYRENPMQIKICQRSAPVWLMSVLQIQQTIPYNARKAVKEVCKIEAGKGVIGREDMEMAFPPVFSNLNLVVVAGYDSVEKRRTWRPVGPCVRRFYFCIGFYQVISFSW